MRIDSQPVGSGPYMLEEASPDNFLKLKRNPDWWFAKASGNPDMPYFDGIHVSIIPDPRGQARQPARRQDRRADARQVAIRSAQGRFQLQHLPLPADLGRRGQ
jgi:ABC-type transport system substrate-binding protein